MLARRAVPVLLLAVLLGLLLPQPAGAASAVRPGKVEVLEDFLSPYPALQAAPANTLRGFGFTAEVKAEACAASLGRGRNEIAAPTGDEVCAFRLGLETSSTFNTSPRPVPGLAGTITAAGEVLHMTAGELLSAGSAEYAFDVPSGSQVTLSLSAAGFTQSWSITHARPLGERPAVLYDPVILRAGESFALSETSLSDNKTASVHVELSSARLCWFLPGFPLTRPARPDEAFLLLGFRASERPGPGGVSFGDFAPVPGEDVRVVLPSGRTEPTKVLAVGALGLFGYPYYATVPASTRSFGLEVSPGTILGSERQGNGPARITRVRFSSGGVGLRAGAGGSRTTGALDAVEVAAPAAAGGGTLVLVFVVPLFWRRRKGKKAELEFPPAGPMNTAEEKVDGENVVHEDGPAPETPENADMTPAPFRLVIRVLGAVAVEPLEKVRRHQVVELCVLLGLVGGPLTSDRARYLLGSEKKDLSPKSFWNLVTELRKALGRDVLVEHRRNGYVLKGDVVSDWETMRELAEKARLAEDATERAALLQEALGLVRGRPFDAVPPGLYRWAETEGFMAEMPNTIVAIAVSAGRELLGLGRREEAFEAAGKGLLVDGYARELYGLQMRACDSPARMEKVFSRALAALGPDPELASLRDELLGADVAGS